MWLILERLLVFVDWSLETKVMTIYRRQKSSSIDAPVSVQVVDGKAGLIDRRRSILPKKRHHLTLMRLQINLPITQNPLNTIVWPAAQSLGLQGNAGSPLVHQHQMIIVG